MEVVFFLRKTTWDVWGYCSVEVRGCMDGFGEGWMVTSQDYLQILFLKLYFYIPE